jgi:hypothetical protein
MVGLWAGNEKQSMKGQCEDFSKPKKLKESI